MNEVRKCSISGVGFTLDADAYQILERYLESLRQTYRDNPDGEEIIADIEARIAELILSTQEGERIVERPLVENIIHQLGSAEEISDRDPDRDLHHETPRIPRRLYRDKENAKLGGVCAGIGRYFDVDPVWIRLGLFAPILLAFLGNLRFLSWIGPLMGNLFGIFLVCYFIMWFAVPVARTARQRLEMTGEKITERSISQATAASSAADPDSVARPVVAEAVSVLGKVVLLFLKLIAGFIVLGLIVSACALIIGLFAVVIGGEELFSPLDGMVDLSIWIPILGIVAVLIPVILLIYVMMCLIASRKPGGKTVLAIFLLEIVAVGALTLLAVREGLDRRVGRRFLTVERVMAPSDSDAEADDAPAPASEIEPGQERIRIGGDQEAVDISIDRKNGRLRLTAGDTEVAVEADADRQSASIQVQKRDSAATR